MSKTFNTARADNKVLKVDNLFGNPRLLIKEFDGDTRGFAFAPSDAPALALAILEAAVGDGPGASNEIDTARLALIREIQRTERATAEAKDKAELEAEARELFKAGFPNNVEPPEIQHSMWLAVARKAREMRAEK